MRKICVHTYHNIISIENLLCAWSEFIKGKRNRKDVQEFQLHLMDNIISLHNDLEDKIYEHGKYEAFNIRDPKPRNIHKAMVRDRLLHHAVYRILYPFFDNIFISDSYSCRLNKGTHRAIEKFKRFSYKVSKNNTRTCWILKCDIKKFFASIDHGILIQILKEYIQDKDIVWLLERIISSFHTKEGKGLPLGNLTSQLFVNIYMNEFDQYVKHKIKVKYYLRYADDFVFLSQDKNYLKKQLQLTEVFLGVVLKLNLHPDKVSIKTLASGVDFLGWVHFRDHRILRTVTKRRMMKSVYNHPRTETISSYLGMLRWGNARKLEQKINLC